MRRATRRIHSTLRVCMQAEDAGAGWRSPAEKELRTKIGLRVAAPPLLFLLLRIIRSSPRLPLVLLVIFVIIVVGDVQFAVTGPLLLGC